MQNESELVLRAMRSLIYLEARSRWLLWPLVLLLIPVLGVIDYATGPEISFGVFYVLPIVLGAYTLGRWAGLFLSLLCALAWLAAGVASGQHFSSVLIAAWNTTSRLIFYVLTTLLLTALRDAYEQQRQLALSDFLTGAANSRAFFQVAGAELARARRYAHPLSLLYIDVDGFKGVNDTRGHQAGDELLTAIAATLRAGVRGPDLVARLGGDEFAVLLPETAASDARSATEKLRARLDTRMREDDWPVSFSIGLVTFAHPPETVEALLAAADALAYEAKRAGKDRIHQGMLDPVGATAGLAAGDG